MNSGIDMELPTLNTSRHRGAWASRTAADVFGLASPHSAKAASLEQACSDASQAHPERVELTAEGSVLLLRERELRLSLQDFAREIADVSQGGRASANWAHRGNFRTVLSARFSQRY